MPDEMIQRRFSGGSGDAVMTEAFNFYLDARKHLADKNWPADSWLLDFGCGWGRISRLFLRDFPRDRLIGVDCTPAVLEIARSTNQWTDFRLVEPLPPTELPTGQFAAVVCFSVFSHLSEDAHLRWLDEFHRLLRPSGLLVATTWPRDYILECRKARESGNSPFARHAAALKAFEDTEDALARYDRGDFVYSGTGAGRVLTEDFYGETCVSRDYVIRHWSPRFDLIEYGTDRSRCFQNTVVVQKHS
jgi:SAM-dependent methyltransferase